MAQTAETSMNWDNSSEKENVTSAKRILSSGEVVVLLQFFFSLHVFFLVTLKNKIYHVHLHLRLRKRSEIEFPIAYDVVAI